MMLKRLTIASMLAFSAGAHAGSQTGTITQISVRSTDGLIAVYLTGTPASRATCASAQPYWIIRDENSTSGKQQLAQLMLASATGKSVTITGTNQCVRWTDGEDIGIVAVVN